MLERKRSLYSSWISAMEEFCKSNRQSKGSMRQRFPICFRSFCRRQQNDKFGKRSAKKRRRLADFLPTISIKAKDFAAEMTSINVQSKNLRDETNITKEHVDNNAAVRKTLINRNIIPENLPPEEDVKKVERRLIREKKKLLKNEES